MARVVWAAALAERRDARAPFDHIVVLFLEAFDFSQPLRPPIALP